MADLPSILGGMAQGFVDFGKGAVDMFGTGGAAIGDLIESARTGKVTTKNQDDFRKWLYQTDSTKDAAAKGLGTALNGVQTVLDYIPGVNVLTRNPLGNAAQGALGGLADEFKTYGEDYDLGRAGQRAAVSGAAAAASGSLADALKGSSNALLSSNTIQGLARGATGGAISGGGYAAIDGGDIMQGALQGAGTGALIGGATGAIQDFMPRKATYDMALTDEEKAARIKNAQDMLANEQNPERIAELNNQIKDLGGTLADADMAVNNPRYLTDENGNPRTFYHGSPNKNITEFDINQAGKNTSSGEHALYFTDSPEVADEFSYERLPSDSMFVDNRGAKGRVYPVNLEMNNPLDLDNLTDAQIRELWQYASPLGQLDGQEKFIKNLTEFRDAAHNGQLTKTLLDLDKLKNSPYDGFTARMYPNQDNQAREYAVFDNSKVKMLEDVLANDDSAVNGVMESRIAPGQSLEKTLANGDAEINRVGSANVAPVDPTTLPDSLKAVQDYLDEGNYIKDIENFAGKPYPKLTNQDYLDYAISLKNPKDKAFYESIIKDMVDDGTTTYEKYAASAARNNRLNKLRMGSYDDIDPKALASYIANHRQALSNGTIRDVDAELSDRLGIGRSNTLMMDNNLPPDALGAYDPTNSTISIDTNAPEENLVNTLAHERLHSFQTEGDFKRYDKRVTDAYEELSKDLNKYLKTPEETAKRYAFDADYWGNEREQQSRMLQQYLENKGFTRGGLQKSNIGEWGNEINPAFDKFFDKLRDLSKRGVALPALAALFGGGAYMASQENDKDKEVK